MNNLSYERLGYDTNYEIALNMSIEQLRFYCVSNPLFNKICNTQKFWLDRLQFEYPITIPYKPIDMSYIQYYFNIVKKNIKLINLVYNYTIIGDVPVFTTDTFKSVAQRVIKIISSKNPNFDETNAIFYSIGFIEFDEIQGRTLDVYMMTYHNFTLKDVIMINNVLKFLKLSTNNVEIYAKGLFTDLFDESEAVYDDKPFTDILYIHQEYNI